MSVIDEVKQRTDIVEIISQYATLTKSGRNFRALCPFHSEKNPSFFIYPDQQSWHCFGACNTGGDVFSFIMKQQNIEFGEALRFLAQRAGVTLPTRTEPDTEKDKKERLYQANESAAQYFHDLLLNSPAAKKARDYLDKRGLSLKTITDFQLGFSLNSWEALKQHLMERGYTEEELLEAGLIVATEEGKTHDRFRNRLIFPIIDDRGRTTGFGGRVLDDSLPKYLNSPQTPVFDKSSTIYGINLAKPAIRQQNLAVIVEGYTDVITAHQNGFTNVVAAMGTSVTDRQLNILRKLSRNMALALDADAAGEEAMLRCVQYENTLDAEVKVLTLPGGRDPDDVIKEDAQTWQRLLDEASPVVGYAIKMITSKLDLNKDDDKASAISQSLPLIDEIKDSISLDRYIRMLSELTGIPYNKIEAALSAYRANKRVRKTRQEATVHATQSLHSHPREEYCLALLLKYPRLRDTSPEPLPEYFESSENREIFLTWQQNEEPSAIKDKLDTALWEHFDAIINKEIPDNQIEQRYADCVLNLKKEYLQNLHVKRAEALALVRESEGTAAEIAKLIEEGIERTIQLREVFTQKGRRAQGQEK